MKMKVGCRYLDATGVVGRVGSFQSEGQNALLELTASL
jgi:hypothetical protein